MNDPRVSKLAEDFGYKQSTGVFVQEVMEGTPSTGKLQKGDVVTALNGKAVKDVQELRNQIAQVAPNTEVTLSVFREGKVQDVKLKVGEQPDDLRVASGRGGKSGEEAGAAESAAKGKLGLGLGDMNDQLAEKFGFDEKIKGAVVLEVSPKSPAFREGLRPGDVITEVGKQKVTNAKEAREALSKADLSKGVRLYVARSEGSRVGLVLGSE